MVWGDEEPRAEGLGSREKERRGQQSATEIQEPAHMNKEVHGIYDQSTRILDIKHILSGSFWFLIFLRNKTEC